MPPSLSSVRAELARRSFAEFVRQAWPRVEPRPLVWSWYLDLLCAELEALVRGETNRLLVNLPPRLAKSLLASVLLPAWGWANDPTLRFMHLSYGEDLALRDSVRCRRLVESEWYRHHFGRAVALVGDHNLKHRFETTAGGSRFAAGLGGALTGEGADVIILDDSLKAKDAHSPSRRDALYEDFTNTVLTRLDDLRRGAILVIGHRLHEDDLFGRLIAQGGWSHTALPAEFEEDHPYPCALDPRTRPGQLLVPERIGREELERQKRDLGPYAFAAQLQQRPSPAGGGIIRRETYRYFDPAAPLPYFDQVAQSWDATFGLSPRADYVVGQLWAARGPDRYLLREVRDRMSFNETLDAIREMTGWVSERLPRQRGHAILIERSANGRALIELLSRELGSVIGVDPDGSKVDRAHRVTPLFEGGNVFVPGAPNADGSGFDRARTPEWVQGHIVEVTGFPQLAHDDRVDAMTQALPHLSRPGPRLWVLG